MLDYPKMIRNHTKDSGVTDSIAETILDRHGEGNNPGTRLADIHRTRIPVNPEMVLWRCCLDFEKNASEERYLTFVNLPNAGSSTKL